jgi:glycosyltransferase involved in cell wall biosynthesis
MKIAFIGSAGIPNRYGGFEAFLETCAPVLAEDGHEVIVTADPALYPDKAEFFRGVRRVFVPIRANGASSVMHDGLAFLMVWWRVRCIVVLGVSGGPWFPFWRALCSMTGRRLLVNVDGVEWRRTKFGRGRRLVLKVFDMLAQRFSHVVIVDNVALTPFLSKSGQRKARHIAYPGDHVLRLNALVIEPGTALTVCRIEPENNVHMNIEGFLRSQGRRYTVVGNWSQSAYGRDLRTRYEGEPRLELLDPIYDANRLADLRGRCEVYIHGHSVGGTNPSLVEMLFYDSHLLCFDCAFNRQTAGNSAEYFADTDELSLGLNGLYETAPPAGPLRQELRQRYTGRAIADQYVSAIGQTYA